MLLTFSAVLFFTMLKEAYEDSQRYKSDRELNNRPTRYYDYLKRKTIECEWSNVKVGQIIKVKKDEEIPADLLIIMAPKDVVFISTMNLDGETNLKERTLPFDSIKPDNIFEFAGSI